MVKRIKVEMSIPDAKALLSLLKTSDSFPDVVEELEAHLNEEEVES